MCFLRINDDPSSILVTHIKRWTWWYPPEIPAPSRWRQVNPWGLLANYSNTKKWAGVKRSVALPKDSSSVPSTQDCL